MVLRGEPMEGSQPIAKKVYYSIGEVCDLSGLKPHVLRYWETQFDVLNPTKNRAGNRVYRSRDVEVVLLVKKLLYEEKYTIEGANQKLIEMRREGELRGKGHQALPAEFITGIKAELEELRSLLDPPPLQEG
jgi:DNA-binding transcriptional MerR regulator